MEMDKQPIVISIEGNIGSGKSTLLEHLRKKYQGNDSICFVEEPVHIWNTIKDTSGVTILEKYYADQHKYAFPFQMMAYISRLSILRQALKNKTYKVIFIERSVYTDVAVFAKMLYDQGVMEPCMYQIYEKMSDDGLRQYMADGILWVNTPPDVCRMRILGRGRPGEEDIGLDYLAQCDCYHREWLGGDTGYVYLVDENVDWAALDMYLYGDTKLMP